MKREKETFGSIGKAALVVITIVVEFAATYMTLVPVVFPYIEKGYWLVVWIPLTIWAFLSILWCYGMYLLITRGKQLFKQLMGGD